MKMTSDEFKAKAKEVIDTCNKYGFMKNKIMPYSFVMTVEELVKNWKDYDHCTYSSKELMQDELIGFLPLLEHWVEVENEPMIKIRLLSGQHAGEIREYHKSTANDFIEMGIAVII